MKIIPVEEFEFVRRRLRNLMPSYMKSFEVECIEREKPDAESLPKKVYVKEWLNIFDSGCGDWEVEQLLDYSVYNLREAFNWTINHYAELDLGANSKWSSALHSVLKYLKRRVWNADNERNIIYTYLIETRWAYADGV